MNPSLKKLRKKYCYTAILIVFAVILLMTIMINVLMQINSRQETNMIADTVAEAAISHTESSQTEHILLEDTEKTDAGEAIILRDVRDISSVTLYGTIQCTDTTAIWYSAGGGLLFEVKDDTGASQMVYKDYTFTKDISSVSVDFTNFDLVKCGYENITIDEADITGEYFLVSGVWWKNSSTHSDYDENVSLELTAMDITYKENVNLSGASTQIVNHITFNDIFEENVPDLLNNTGLFYLITNQNNQLLTVNDGNLTEAISTEEAENYMHQIVKNNNAEGKIRIDETVYTYRVQSFGQQKLFLIINDNLMSQASRQLLWITIGVAALILLIFVLLIYKTSGYVIRPLEQSMEQQKQFISNASHELKTPITVISATIDLIARNKGEDAWTQRVREQAQKMKQLVMELLDLSRLQEVHTAKVSFAEHDLSTVVSNSLLYFECLFFEQNKHLEQDIQENISLTIDEQKISQLVGILVDNALKYSDEKSTISVKLYKEKDHIILTCENPCQDFVAEDAAKLFERFYRSDNDHSQEQEGFGLGLSIAQAIVALHQGKIEATYHAPNITFTVTLPTKKTPSPLKSIYKKKHSK